MSLTTVLRSSHKFFIFSFLICTQTVFGLINTNVFLLNNDTNSTKSDTIEIELQGSYIEVIPNKFFNLKVKRFILIPENQEHNFSLSKKLNFFEPYFEGRAFSSGMNDFVYVNEGYKIALNNKEKFVTYKIKKGEEINYPLNQIIKLPPTIVYNLNRYEIDKNNKFILDSLSSKEIQKVLEPFYFSKYEVSVKEYGEFMDWVRKTNGYDALPYKINDIKTVSLKSNEDVLLKKQIKWVINKEKAYNYKFYKENPEIIQEYNKNEICIAPIDSIELFYPLDGFNNEYYDINMIYINNDIDNTYKKYPVVGVNYYQALAFLDWKTHFQQKFLDSQGSKILVEFLLPNSIEHRLIYDNSINFDNDNWICDLKLTKEELLESSLDRIINNNILSSKNDTVANIIFENSLTDVNKATSINSKSFDTRFAGKENHIIKNKIQFLDANVSEWMRDSYKDNWYKALKAHKKQYGNSEADKISSAIEDYYNTKNDNNGRLVMGGNYIDYRQSMVYAGLNDYKNKINKAGIEQKRFVNPKTQKSTIGFRYIIKVKEKDFEHKDSLLRLVGTYSYSNYSDYPYDFNKYFSKYIQSKKESVIDSVDEWYFEINTKKEKLVSRAEITNGMWRQFIISLFEVDSTKELAYKYAPKDSLWQQYNDNYLYYFKNLKYDDLPVVNISHQAVIEFNKWITQRYNKGEYLSAFNLPTEIGWSKFAMSDTTVEYAWKTNKAKELKLHNLANIKTPLYDSISNYINKNLYKYTNNDSLVLKYKDLPESIGQQIYNERYIGVIKYNKFKEKEFLYHKFPYLIGTTENNYKNIIGLYNLHGNVAEMLDTAIITKGGSWNSYLQDVKILDSETWDGTPSPMIGFRNEMNLPEKIDSAMLINIMSRIPPGTILLTKDFGVDILEMRNIDYLKFINYVAHNYGRDSKQYKEILPKTGVWKNVLVDGKDLSKIYFNNPKFYNNPLVGITYEQAVIYTKWRTEYINNYYQLYHLKYVRSIGVPKKVTYRLPTPEEWDKILTTESIYLPDEGIVYPNYTNPIKEEDAVNKRINKGLTSSVFYYWKNKIGLYAFDDNVSEMTSEPGVARGCNWTGGQENTDCKYKEPTNWIGFRCVVDVEY